MKKLPPYQIAISPLDKRWRLGNRLKAYQEYEADLEWEEYEFKQRLKKILKRRADHRAQLRIFFFLRELMDLLFLFPSRTE